MPKEPLALLGRHDLIKMIYELEARVKELERVMSPGWGAWKFENEKDNKQKQIGEK